VGAALLPWTLRLTLVVFKGLGFHPSDPTFGRYLAPTSPYEHAIDRIPSIRVTRRRVFTSRSGPAVAQLQVGDGEEVKLTQAELDAGRGKEWTYYQIWENQSEKAMKGKAQGCDLVLLHGMCDYGEKWGPHVERFAEMGFRLIVPDLASHGRSTGVHVHLSSAYKLTDGVHAVLTDLKRWSPGTRKTYLSGSSLGGWTSLTYALRHPDPPTPLGGLFLIAPLIGVAPETMPPYPIYLIGLALQSFAGRLPLTAAVKGKVSDDPRVEAEFFADPRCYHGDMRIATGLSLLTGLQSLIPANLNIPVRIVHGNKDRATDPIRSVEFIKLVVEKDAEIELYEGYEHVMLRVGANEQDDKKRQVVLADMAAWLEKRCG